jgi:hypothetical protein
MNDIETVIRETLHQRAGEPPIRRLPPGTMRLIRRRQAGFSAALIMAGAAAVALAAGVVRILPQGSDAYGPGGGPLVGPTHPIESVPAGWPRVDVRDPSDAYTIPEHIADADGRVDVLASGTVAGAEFSFMAWTGGREEDGVAGPCIGFAGPWSGGPPPTDPALEGFGGIVSHTCAHWHEEPVPAAADLYLAGQRDRQSAPGIAANYGVVSGRVARLEVRLDDGSSTEFVILDGPPRWQDVKAFIFFPPAGREGTVTAFDLDGRALARAEICQAVQEDAAGGCAGPTEQLVTPAEPEP